MTDEDLVRRFAAVIGVGKVTMPKRREGRKQNWQWRGFGGAAMRRLDETIGPWLGERRRARLDEMLTFVPARDGERGAWIERRQMRTMRLTDSEITDLLRSGASVSEVIRRGVSHARIVQVRDGFSTSSTGESG